MCVSLSLLQSTRRIKNRNYNYLSYTLLSLSLQFLLLSLSYFWKKKQVLQSSINCEMLNPKGAKFLKAGKSGITFYSGLASWSQGGEIF